MTNRDVNLLGLTVSLGMVAAAFVLHVHGQSTPVPSYGVCIEDTGAPANAITCTIPNFTLTQGSLVSLYVNTSNNSAGVTLAINGGAAFPLFRGTSNGPDPGELAPNGTPILLSFNGSIFQIVNDSFEAGGSQLLTFSRAGSPWTIDANNGPGALCATAEACWPVVPITPTMVIGETPKGTVNGTNDVFYLAHSPSPVTSVAVYLAGQRLTNCATCQFYSYISGAYATGGLHFNAGSVPQPGATIQVDYQY